VLEYVVLPQLPGASRSFRVLDKVDWPLVTLVVAFEAGAICSYAMLTRSALRARLGFSRILRINLSALAVSHVLPGGTAPATALSYRLMVGSGLAGGDATFALGVQGLGSAVCLNLLLWLALLSSIPIHVPRNPLYLVVAGVGAGFLALVAVVVLSLTRFSGKVTSALEAVARLLRLSKRWDIKHETRRLSENVALLFSDRRMLARVLFWGSCYSLLDAASLWSSMLALGKLINPVDVFVAYGAAYVLAFLPITPSGLGIVEGVLIPSLVGFGASGAIATLAVLGYRLFNFWLPIPVGVGCYLSLRLGGRTPWTAAKTAEQESRFAGSPRTTCT
jgi:uncharacterized protein (TIRG00374 family)